ncbi:MAG: PKD domain-containing protein [Planctomycetota bacterium]
MYSFARHDHGLAWVILSAISLFVHGCGSMSADNPAGNGVAAGTDSVSPASDTLFSTIETPDFGRYDLVARGPDDGSGEWQFAVRSGRGAPAKNELRFVWDFGDGKTYEGVEQSHSFTTNGSYVIKVTAIKLDGTVAFLLTLNVEVAIDVNEPPIADAGTDQTADANALVFLYGGASSDPDGDPLTYQWVQISGEPVLLLHANEPTASFIAPSIPQDADLVFGVTVGDGGYAEQDTVVVRVLRLVQPAQALLVTADAGADQLNVLQGTTVTLDGSGSNSSDGSPLTYAWSPLPGTNVTLQPTTDPAIVTFTAPGLAQGEPSLALFFELVVSAGDQSASDEVRVTVTSESLSGGTDPVPPVPPVPTEPCVTSSPTWQNTSLTSQSSSFEFHFDAVPNNANMDGIVALSQSAGATFADYAVMVRFNAAGSIDIRDGATYAADAAVPYSAGTNYGFRVVVDVPAGAYNVYVTPEGGAELTLAADYAFRSGPSSVGSLGNWAVWSDVGGSLDVCNVALAAVALTASAGSDVTIAPGGSAQLSGSASGGTPPYTYRWSPITGLNNPNAAQPTATPALTTTYALTVTDAASNSASDSVVVTVQTVAPLTASAGPDQTISPGGSTTLTGGASGGASPYTYRWSPTTALSNANVAQPTASPAVTTTYTFSVTDAGAVTSTDSVIVTVQASPLTASAGADKVIAAGGSTTLDGGASGGVAPYRFSWSPAATLSDSAIARPTAQPMATTTYVLTVTDNVGATNTDSVTVTVQSSSAGLTPIARWDVVPYQRISPSETLNCGVVAFSKFGIQKVAFTVNGQGYTGASPVEVTEMTLNNQTNVWEYWFSLRASSFTSDGPITVEAVVYGKDGGIRTKSTDGGGVGLDALPLNVNPKGTLPQATAWVSVAGDDATGKVNDSTKPLLTVMAAIAAIRNWNASNGYGNNADGGIVYLNAGTHQFAKPPWQTGFGETLNPNEWVTVTAAPGLSRDRVLLTRQYSIQDVEKVRVKGLTLQGASVVGCDWDESPSPNHISNRMKVWVDDSALIGSGKDVWASHPVSSVPQTGYYTNSYVTSVSFAHPPVTGIQLSRGMTIEHIGNDAFQNVPLAINARIDDLAPGPADPATPCPDPPDGSTCWHADVVGDGGLSKGNVIIYNVRATKARYQGIWCNIKPEGQINGYAFVNVYIETVNPVSGDWCCRSGYMFAVDHLLFWHVSFVSNTPGDPNSHSLLFAHDGKPTAMTNVSVVGSVFDAVYINPNPLLSLQTSGWLDNHYVKWDPIGTRYTTGPHLLDSYGVPTSSSPLADRVRTLVVPIDANNRPRTNGGDVGAYER